jgi:deazaflavin-dependent oxidoreductase (nitroreductase family)
MVADRSMKLRPVKRLIRWLCQSLINRMVLRTAGRARSICAIVTHVGRRSGAEHRNPVMAYRAGKWFIIGLPYGEDCDWCRNVLAAGGCVVQWRGEEYRATNPRLLRAEVVGQRLPARHRAFLGAMGVQSYLMMKASEPIALAS